MPPNVRLDDSADVVREIADPSRAVDSHAADELRSARDMLLSVQKRRERVRSYQERLSKRPKTWKNCVYLLLNAPVYPVDCLVDRRCRRRSAQEWETRRGERGGSEMYLFFQRERRPEDR